MAVIEVKSEDLDQLLAENKSVVLDVWAPWCGPCKAFAPIYERISGHYDEVVFAKIDAEANEAVNERFSIISIPTLLFFSEGAIVHRQTGGMRGSELSDLVNEHLSR